MAPRPAPPPPRLPVATNKAEDTAKREPSTTRSYFPETWLWELSFLPSVSGSCDSCLCCFFAFWLRGGFLWWWGGTSQVVADALVYIKQTATKTKSTYVFLHTRWLEMLHRSESFPSAMVGNFPGCPFCTTWRWRMSTMPDEGKEGCWMKFSEFWQWVGIVLADEDETTLSGADVKTLKSHHQELS